MSALTAVLLGVAAVAVRRAPRLAAAPAARLRGVGVRVRPGALTRTGRCRRCGDETSAQTNFCSGCGAALWEFTRSAG